MFHQMLAQHGIVVWILDNRSASGKGAESQWPVYGRLGELELQDLEDGITWLKQQTWVDPSRLVLSGWSYGGFMTAYALTHSTSWSAGIVGAPVTDWRDYDSVYTERLMKLPQHNADGYRRTAPRFAADRLNARMLLIHGTMDDNVHMQNSVQFAYELQKAGKPFEMMVYAEVAPRLQRSAADRASPPDDVRFRDACDRACRSRPAVVPRVDAGQSPWWRSRRRRGGASPSASRVGFAGGHGRLDRQLPRDPSSREASRSGVSHRQRRRHTGREQPSASERESRATSSHAIWSRRFSRASTRSTSACRTPNKHGSRDSRRSWSSAATRPWAILDASSMPGTCVVSSASASRASRSGDGRIHMPQPTQQVDFLLDPRFCAEFYLTQVVSHLNLEPVKRFLDEADRRQVPLPGMFSVFYYRSANPKTLATLSRFMPVPDRGPRQRVRRRRDGRRCLRAHACEPCGRSVCGISASAICRCRTRGPRFRRSSRKRLPLI